MADSAAEKKYLLDAAQTAASLTARMTIVMSVEREKIGHLYQRRQARFFIVAHFVAQ